jgi:hypothetical protein
LDYEPEGATTMGRRRDKNLDKNTPSQEEEKRIYQFLSPSKAKFDFLLRNGQN